MPPVVQLFLSPQQGCHAHLKQAFPEQDLDGLLQDGQQAAVVDADAALQQRQHVFHLDNADTMQTKASGLTVKRGIRFGRGPAGGSSRFNSVREFKRSVTG